MEFEQDHPNFKLRKQLMAGMIEGEPILDIGGGNLDWGYKDIEKIDWSPEAKPDYVWNLENGLPKLKRKYKTIIAGEIIEHIVNIEKLLDDCHAALADGGVMVISTPNILSLRNRVFALLGKDLPYSSWDWNIEEKGGVRHVNDFSWRRVELLFGKHGFRIEEKKTTGFCAGSLLIPHPNFLVSLGDEIIAKVRKV